MGLQQFSILIEATGDAAFAVDATGRISAWNNAAAELFGLSKAETIGVKCHHVLQCSDEHGGVCSEHCVVECAGHDGVPLTNFDLRLQTRTRKLWCNLTTLMASDAAGVRHAIHIVHPVETHKRLEQAVSEFVRMQASATPHVAAITSTPAPDSNGPLTAREKEVLKRMAKGQSTRVIANQLNISSATVNNHVRHILSKLNSHTRLEAIRNAESAGVI